MGAAEVAASACSALRPRHMLAAVATATRCTPVCNGKGRREGRQVVVWVSVWCLGQLLSKNNNDCCKGIDAQKQQDAKQQDRFLPGSSRRRAAPPHHTPHRHTARHPRGTQGAQQHPGGTQEAPAPTWKKST